MNLLLKRRIQLTQCLIFFRFISSYFLKKFDIASAQRLQLQLFSVCKSVSILKHSWLWCHTLYNVQHDKLNQNENEKDMNRTDSTPSTVRRLNRSAPVRKITIKVESATSLAVVRISPLFRVSEMGPALARIAPLFFGLVTDRIFVSEGII